MGARLSSRQTDLAVALALIVAAGIVYGLTANPDWHFDSLRFADYLQRGEERDLVRILHASGNLLSLAMYRGFDVVGLDVSPLVALGAVNILLGAAAVGAVYLAARQIGAGTARAALIAAGFGMTLGAWRASGRMTIYGVALGSIAVAWLALARCASSTTDRAAAWAGAAAGLSATAHLGALALLPAGGAIVLLGGARSLRVRIGRATFFALGAVATSAVVFTLAAGVANKWSPIAMWEWFAGPQVGVADESRIGGFGFQGMVLAVAGSSPFLFLGRNGVPSVGAVACVALIACAMGAAAMGLRRGGPTRAVALALLLHASIAILGAAWFVPDHPDHFSLGLVPLVLLLAIVGNTSWPSRTGRGQMVALLGIGAVAVVALAGWNFRTTVHPALERSHLREKAAEQIVEVVAPNSHLLLSPAVVPRVAYSGLRAETGWAALYYSVRAGSSLPGLSGVIDEGVPLFVSGGAFDLSPAQEGFLGTTGPMLWSDLERCCRLRRLLVFRTDTGPETLFRVGVP